MTSGWTLDVVLECVSTTLSNEFLAGTNDQHSISTYMCMGDWVLGSKIVRVMKQ